VRLRNRGGFPADLVQATVYWSLPATLVMPDHWNLIGTSGTVAVPTGDTLVVTPAVTWPAAQIPPAGHYCLIVKIDHPLDPAPAVPSAGTLSWSDFLSLIRNENNVTWRNINVVDLPAGVATPLEFLVAGAPDESLNFEFEIIQRLPESAVPLELVVPPALLNALHPHAFSAQRMERINGQPTFMLPRRPSLFSQPVVLPRGSRFVCQLAMQASRDIMPHHHVTIRQLFERLEVGRITWRFRTVAGARVQG